MRSHDEDQSTIRDMLHRAIAALRERNELPDIAIPSFSVAPVSEDTPRAYSAPIGGLIAERAKVAGLSHIHPASIAQIIATYAQEVADIVPAYSFIRSVTSTLDGDVVVTVTD